MQFAAAACASAVSVCLLVGVHASSALPASLHGPTLTELIAARIRSVGPGALMSMFNSEAAEEACNWANQLSVVNNFNVPLDLYVNNYRVAIETRAVQAALSQGALSVLLASKEELLTSDSLDFFKTIACPLGLTYSMCGSRFTPVLLLASGKYTVRSEVVEAVTDMVAPLHLEEKWLFPYITYALAMQFVLHGSEDSWKAFYTWITRNADSAFSNRLIAKLLLSWGTDTIEIPPQPAMNMAPITAYANIATNFKNVVKEVVKHAPESVLTSSLELNYCSIFMGRLINDIWENDKVGSITLNNVLTKMGSDINLTPPHFESLVSAAKASLKDYAFYSSNGLLFNQHIYST